MYAGLGVDVVERQYVVVFINLGAGDVPSDDAAEDAVGHI